MEVFYDHNRVPIFHVIEIVGLGPGHFPDNGHGCSLNNRGRIEKFLLNRQESPL